jgi:hypothetical protein
MEAKEALSATSNLSNVPVNLTMCVYTHTHTHVHVHTDAHPHTHTEITPLAADQTHRYMEKLWAATLCSKNGKEAEDITVLRCRFNGSIHLVHAPTSTKKIQKHMCMLGWAAELLTTSMNNHMLS